MRFRFKKRGLQALFLDNTNSDKYTDGTVTAFFELMSVIQSAKDERDFRALKSLHYEKLSGKRKKQHSLRLNRQFRLIVEWEDDLKGKQLIIIDIEDYH